MKVVLESPNFTTYFSQTLFTASDAKSSMSPCLSAGTQFCTGHGIFQLAAQTHWGCYNWVCTATALNNTSAIRGLPCAHNSQMLRPSFNVRWQLHSIIMKCSMAASPWYWTVILCQSTPVASALPRKKNEKQPNTQTNKKPYLYCQTHSCNMSINKSCLELVFVLFQSKERGLIRIVSEPNPGHPLIEVVRRKLLSLTP